MKTVILKDKGWTVRYLIEEDEDGYPSTLIYVDYEKNGENTKIREFIEDEVDESLHECIRGNVLLDTRYFNHRVKAFMKNITMGGGNPMNVDKFSYRQNSKQEELLMCMEPFG